MVEWISFGVLSVVAVFSALLMVMGRNPVHSALWLVLSFFAVAGFYLILGSEFLMVVQIIVYAGAIMVLFLFVVMLLNLEREQEPLITGAQRVVGIGLAMALLAILAGVVGAAARPQAGTAAAAQVIGIRDLGTALYTEWLFPFELASVLLLVAMVGAIALARRRA